MHSLFPVAGFVAIVYIANHSKYIGVCDVFMAEVTAFDSSLYYLNSLHKLDHARVNRT